MSAFFSKVFSRKKADDKEQAHNKRTAGPHLLDGKFEAVSPTVSFAAEARSPTQEGKASEKSPDKEKPALALFRPKSRTKSPTVSPTNRRDDIPHLTLNLPGPKGEEKRGRDLGVVFEAGTDGKVSLDDSVLGERRLAPLEALILIRACAQVIQMKGLETLGIMHPHWHSSTPAIQRRILSLFINSLASKTPITTLTPTPAALNEAFESEINYSRDPHDLATVLRWGLRHLRLEGGSFGKEVDADLSWYDTFARTERDRSFPPKAYSDILVPLLPPAHLELLTATLNLMSSLAAHSVFNGVSGSKLSMLFGHSLLTGNKLDGVHDLMAFYELWDRAGRILEHVFLSHVRDESSKGRIPVRLMELIVSYPYPKQQALETDPARFPRPRFSTHRYNALHVRLTRELGPGDAKPKRRDPMKVAEDALGAPYSEATEFSDIWEQLRATSSQQEGESAGPALEASQSLSRIFSDETIQLLSLPSLRNVKQTDTPITMFTPAPHTRQTSFITETEGRTTKIANGNGPSSTLSPVSPSFGDWNVFSTAGFGESAAGSSLAATLLDSDVERTEPPPLSRKSSRKERGRRSGEKSVSRSPDPKDLKVSSTTLRTIELDEAFIDFWADALTDPVTASWPTFIICQLRSALTLKVNDKPLEWLIIEEGYERKQPEPQSPVHRASSPKPSTRSKAGSEKRIGPISRVSSTFTRRFNFFGGSSDSLPEEPGLKGGRIGEMGEIIPEEKETGPGKDTLKGTAKAPAGADRPLSSVAEVATKEMKPTVVAPEVKAAPSSQPPDSAINIPTDFPQSASAVEAPASVAENKEVEQPAAPLAPVSPIPEEAPVKPFSPVVEPPAVAAAAAVAGAAVATIAIEETSQPTQPAEPSQPAELDVPAATAAATGAGERPESPRIGAGESRFIEHITPPDSQKLEEKVPEAATDSQVHSPMAPGEIAAPVPQQPAAIFESVPAQMEEVAREEAPEPAAEDIVSESFPEAEVKAPVDISVAQPTPATEIVPHVQAPTVIEEEAIEVPAVEEPVSETKSLEVPVSDEPALDAPEAREPEPAPSPIEEVAQEAPAVLEPASVAPVVEEAEPVAEPPVPAAVVEDSAADASAVEEVVSEHPAPEPSAIDESVHVVSPPAEEITSEPPILEEPASVATEEPVPIVAEPVPEESSVVIEEEAAPAVDVVEEPAQEAKSEEPTALEVPGEEVAGVVEEPVVEEPVPEPATAEPASIVEPTVTAPSEESTPEIPVVEEPVLEAPAAEEPALETEVVVTEAPSVPVVEESAAIVAVVEEPAAPVAETAPAEPVEEPASAEPTARESVADEPVPIVEEPAVEPTQVEKLEAPETIPESAPIVAVVEEPVAESVAPIVEEPAAPEPTPVPAEEPSPEAPQPQEETEPQLAEESTPEEPAAADEPAPTLETPAPEVPVPEAPPVVEELAPVIEAQSVPEAPAVEEPALVEETAVEPPKPEEPASEGPPSEPTPEVSAVEEPAHEHDIEEATVPAAEPALGPAAEDPTPAPPAEEPATSVPEAEPEAPAPEPVAEPVEDISPTPVPVSAEEAPIDAPTPDESTVPEPAQANGHQLEVEPVKSPEPEPEVELAAAPEPETTPNVDVAPVEPAPLNPPEEAPVPPSQPEEPSEA